MEARRSQRSNRSPHGRYLDSDLSAVEEKKKDRTARTSKVSEISLPVLKVILLFLTSMLPAN